MSDRLVALGKRAPDVRPQPVAAEGAPRVYVETYGCQMNVADSDLIGSVLAEAGYGGVRAWTSFSVMAPAKVPPAVVKKLADEVHKALRNPAVVQRLEQQALIPVLDTPEEFAGDMRKERQHWGDFIRRNNIQPD